LDPGDVDRPSSRSIAARLGMAKAGEAAKARTERKANIKQKKKFSNKNSIGKTRRNVGSEARYVTRTGAVKKLQVKAPCNAARPAAHTHLYDADPI